MFGKDRNLPPLGDGDAELADSDRVPYAERDLRRVPRIKFRYVAGVLGLLFVVAVLRGHQSVPITTSCTTPAFALDSSSPSSGDVDRFSITGPDGTYLLTVDVVKLTVNADQSVRAELADGTVVAQDHVIGKPQHVEKCVAHDAGVVRVPQGKHSVQLWRIVGTTATKVSETAIDVDAPTKR